MSTYGYEYEEKDLSGFDAVTLQWAPLIEKFLSSELFKDANDEAEFFISFFS